MVTAHELMPQDLRLPTCFFLTGMLRANSSPVSYGNDRSTSYVNAFGDRSTVGLMPAEVLPAHGAGQPEVTSCICVEPVEPTRLVGKMHDSRLYRALPT